MTSYAIWGAINLLEKEYFFKLPLMENWRKQNTSNWVVLPPTATYYLLPRDDSLWFICSGVCVWKCCGKRKREKIICHHPCNYERLCTIIISSQSVNWYGPKGINQYQYQFRTRNLMHGYFMAFYLSTIYRLQVYREIIKIYSKVQDIRFKFARKV